MDTQPQPNPPQLAKDDSERIWIEIAIGMVALMSITAIILSAFAIAASSSASEATAAPGPSSASALGTWSAPVSKAEAVRLAVKADDERGKRGPDGKWHDAFLPADFTVHAGDKVTVTVKNYDGGAHTFTSPAMGLNAKIPGGSLKSPREVSFTFTAPNKPGRYAWWCAMPCDPWAMAHDGYMRGYVTVAA